MSTDPKSRAWVEVSPTALRRNLAKVRDAVGAGVRLLPLVKADAYGTGMVSAVRALEKMDPWGFGVATVPEGLVLRDAGVERPILVLSPVPHDVVDAAVASDLTLCVSDLELLRRIESAAARADTEARVHLEIDTGMGRSGFDPVAVESWAPEVVALTSGCVTLEGVFTHFHSADEEDDWIEEQWGRFREVVQVLADHSEGSGGWIIHAANSPAALRRPDMAEGLVRPGIFLYGGAAGVDLPLPEDVVSVRARVVRVREVAPGTLLGYGRTYRSERPERWATLGIGYGDGLPRSLGNRGFALVSGERVPIIGRISMDLTVVDITRLGAPGPEVGAVATLVGTDGNERITLDEVAGLAGTISYEILTGLSPRLPRVWNDNDEGKA